MNKRGFELTLNFVVILILSVVVLSFGIKFIHDLVASQEQIIPPVDQQIRNELARLIVGNKRVAIAFNKATIQRGSSEGFGLGIRNTDPTKTYFRINAQCMKYGSPEQEDLSSGCPPDALSLSYDKSQIRILNNEYEDTMIVVKVDKRAPPGNYVVYVNVCSYQSAAGSCPIDDSVHRYDQLQKIFVTVP
ncbi:hypothetical protein DRJ48_04375 [Candidatus Woesearchaeota archaeon]|nr:hypothetical protein [Candidatus Woesearchaeota archaeon]RLE42039.1 MAG: hypothetical protein DRJ48_04375 [Candidatus Woesearchaeota archaeon]